MKAWPILVAAGLLEVCWVSSLKSTDGFTKPAPTLFFAATLAGSMDLLAVAARTLPIGTAYAISVGIGAAGTAVAGILIHDEPMSIGRGFFLAIVLIAIVGLKFSTPLG